METEQVFNCDEVSSLPTFHQGFDMTCWAGYAAHNHSPFPQGGLGSGTTKLVNVIMCYSMSLKAWIVKCFLWHLLLAPKWWFLLLLLIDGRKAGKGVHCKVVEDRGDDASHEISLFPKSFGCEATHGRAGCLLPRLNIFSLQDQAVLHLLFYHSYFMLSGFIKINLLIIFPVIVSGDFLLLVFLYCPFPLPPSQSALVRTVFCS